MPAFCHFPSCFNVLADNLSRSKPLGGTDRPPSFQAVSRSASHFAVGFSRAVARLSPDPAAFSGTREDSSVFVPVSSASPGMAQAAVEQLPCGVVSRASFPLYHSLDAPGVPVGVALERSGPSLGCLCLR